MIQKVEFKSKYLNIKTNITLITPNNHTSPELVLILLHGSIYPEGEYSIFEHLPNDLHLQELCDDYKLMIVLPFIPINCYYISSKDFDCDGFLAEELPAFVFEKYPVIMGKEIVLGGISMGGYGAVLIGSHTGRFQRILSISGAFIQEDILIGNPEIWGHSFPDNIDDNESYLRHFMPLADLEVSVERNVICALEAFSGKGKRASFFLTCGTEDMLYERNKSFEKTLKKCNFNYNFLSIKGVHDNACFKKGLWAGVEWLFS